MNAFLSILQRNMRARMKDTFIIGYNIVFPIIMCVLLGALMASSYQNKIVSFQYYALVVIPFCIAMTTITVSYVSKEEANEKTAVRYLNAPISYGQIVISKLISCMVIFSVCNVFLLMLAGLILKWNNVAYFLPVFIVLTAETFFSVSCGLLIGFTARNFLMVKNIINIPICIAAVLGGTFFPIGTMNKTMQIFLNISPLTWINRSLFLCIYDHTVKTAWMTAIVLVLLGMLFLSATIILFKKEEFINGNLSDYEK